MTVHTVCPCISNISDIGGSSCDLRRVRSVRERLYTEIHKVSYLVCIIDNYFFSLLLAKVRELIKHFFSCPEIQITLEFCVTEAHTHEHIFSVTAVFLIKEMRVSGCTAHHSVIVSSLNKQLVDDLHVIFIYSYRPGI